MKHNNILLKDSLFITIKKVTELLQAENVWQNIDNETLSKIQNINTILSENMENIIIDYELPF